MAILTENKRQKKNRNTKIVHQFNTIKKGDSMVSGIVFYLAKSNNLSESSVWKILRDGGYKGKRQ